MGEFINTILLIVFAILFLIAIRQFLIILAVVAGLYGLILLGNGRLEETIDSITADPSGTMFGIGVAFWGWVALKVLTVPVPVEVADYPGPSR